MSHDHAHPAGHSHQHAVPLKGLNTAFILGIILNLLFVLIEVVAGLLIHSLSLLSDAGHNLADVAGLSLSLLAFRLLKVKSTANYTYGFRKTSVLVALFNAAILLVSIGAIAFEAVHRLIHPAKVPGMQIALIAGIGILINAFTAFLCMRCRNTDLNIKAAYLHLLSDAVVSLGIVVGGLLMAYTHWFWLDPALSLLIAAVILVSTWNLFRNSLRLSLDGVPENIHLADIKSIAENMEGVKDLHHIHIWAISTTENALTAHLVLDPKVSQEQERKIKSALKHALLHHNIHHTTLETEREDVPCSDLDPC